MRSKPFPEPLKKAMSLVIPIKVQPELTLEKGWSPEAREAAAAARKAAKGDGHGEARAEGAAENAALRVENGQAVESAVEDARADAEWEHHVDVAKGRDNEMGDDNRPEFNAKKADKALKRYESTREAAGKKYKEIHSAGSKKGLSMEEIQKEYEATAEGRASKEAFQIYMKVALDRDYSAIDDD